MIAVKMKRKYKDVKCRDEMHFCCLRFETIADRLLVFLSTHNLMGNSVILF